MFGSDFDFADDYLASAFEDMDEKKRWMRERLPWLTEKQFSELLTHPNFPGWHADYTALSKFVDGPVVSRIQAVDLPCRIHLGGVSLSAMFNPKSRNLYLRDGSRYQQWDGSGLVTLEFGNGGHAFTVRVITGTVIDPTDWHLQAAIAACRLK